MKARLLLLSLITLAAFGCGDGAADTKPGDGKTAGATQGGSPIDPNTIQQIPAKEILGAKVERHLRYQPEEEVSQYVAKLSDIDAFLFAVSSMIRKEVGELTPETPAYGTVVVGVNAQGQHRIWYVWEGDGPSPTLRAAFAKAVASAPPLVVQKELVVVGFAVTLWGYQETHEQAGRIILPQEWQDANQQFSTPQKATKLAQLTWDKVGA